MLSRLRDIWTMLRVAGYGNTVGLWRHSKTLASSVRNHAVLDVLIALEKCGLLAQLGTQHGVTPAALAGFDAVQLKAALEYLTEVEILELLGVDVSERAIAEGRRRGHESGPVRLLVGDAMALESTAAKLKSTPEIVSMMFVLHEFDDEGVERILGSIHRAFPLARILLTEMILRETEEALARNNTALPELRYVHQLSGQVVRSRDQWVHLLDRSRYRPAPRG